MRIIINRLSKSDFHMRAKKNPYAGSHQAVLQPVIQAMSFMLLNKWICDRMRKQGTAEPGTEALPPNLLFRLRLACRCLGM